MAADAVPRGQPRTIDRRAHQRLACAFALVVKVVGTIVGQCVTVEGVLVSLEDKVGVDDFAIPDVGSIPGDEPFVHDVEPVVGPDDETGKRLRLRSLVLFLEADDDLVVRPQAARVEMHTQGLDGIVRVNSLDPGFNHQPHQRVATANPNLAVDGNGAGCLGWSRRDRLFDGRGLFDRHGLFDGALDQGSIRWPEFKEPDGQNGSDNHGDCHRNPSDEDRIQHGLF